MCMYLCERTDVMLFGEKIMRIHFGLKIVFVSLVIGFHEVRPNC